MLGPSDGGLVMDTVSIDLENCYGIKALKTSFDFSKERAYAIYAPNGVMKSSLAQTFQDIVRGADSKDRIFLERVTTRNIRDEHGNPITPESVFVIRPYDEEFGPSEKTSSLLVDTKLRKEYEKLQAGIDASKATLLKLLKKQSGSKRDLEQEIAIVFTSSEPNFKTAMGRIRKEVTDQKDAPFADIPYDKIFDDKVITFLQTNKDAQAAILGYVERYNKLLAASTYFKRGTFDYYNAGQIAKSLATNGFFAASHTVNLKGGTKPIEIKTQKELEEVISKEKDSIIKDAQLRKQFDDLQKALDQNVTLREFYNYLLQHEVIVSQLSNIAKFKEDVLRSYLKEHVEQYSQLMSEYDTVEKRSREIEAEAAKQQTRWEKVVDIFNGRFVVPFTLSVNNRTDVMLGNAAMISLGFTYHDGDHERDIDRKSLLSVLSTGERKALYVLNILFEISTREESKQETLLIVDDIADSFDYQNKYAIIQYLRDIGDNPLFKQLILTHNFDFFRTVKMRFVSYGHCRMAHKSDDGIQVGQAAGIENIFVNDWRGAFFTDQKKKIASIAFMRNIVEYTRGPVDPVFIKLTSLLHWKDDSASITEGDLNDIYISLFSPAPAVPPGRSDKPMVEIITEQAQQCISAGPGLNFENKIVLSIAIRLAAEQFMVKKIADPGFVAGITKNQTYELIKKFKEKFPADVVSAAILERVSLMTPENIHLNSFMYEPIVDMSDEHLRKLCQDVVAMT
jgi:hypothetical protein